MRVITLGTGVARSTWIIVSSPGICPSRAPAMNSREAVNSVPFTPPGEKYINIGGGPTTISHSLDSPGIWELIFNLGRIFKSGSNPLMLI